ncbi:MAG: hypothetical protein ABEL51_16045 [Salinibacter sp.]
MSETTRNRYIGGIVFLLGIVGIGIIQQLSGTTGAIVSFFAGACLGLGSILFATGHPPWESDRWRAGQHPLQRDWL